MQRHGSLTEEDTVTKTRRDQKTCETMGEGQSPELIWATGKET